MEEEEHADLEYACEACIKVAFDHVPKARFGPRAGRSVDGELRLVKTQRTSAGARARGFWSVAATPSPPGAVNGQPAWASHPKDRQIQNPAKWGPRIPPTPSWVLNESYLRVGAPDTLDMDRRRGFTRSGTRGGARRARGWIDRWWTECCNSTASLPLSLWKRRAKVLAALTEVVRIRRIRRLLYTYCCQQ